ncbi:MAG: tRNA (adenosine(37)-N6)-threonylcarbamoyltransferase complex ATPase subunit type 1 TsaE, partial [Pseudomonadota bacterium]|nr:tRNA (adenosine(37)-N6)-threonylcarbamoyltransferase complex ATPase subunit type 1 TsaE [Pseudomonadota bacterium]
MHIVSQGPEATEAWARSLSLFAKPGLVVLLKGDLGAGKSTFARAFIKALAIDEKDFDVPSPTFTLVQTYDDLRVPVAHVDLYRLGTTGDLAELGLEELAKTHLLLIEWPQDSCEKLSVDWLHLTLSGSGTNRDLAVDAHGAWAKVLQRNAEIETFLNAQNITLTSRHFFEGDASSRRYEKVQSKTVTLILMDMPQRPDGPPVKNGRPYSAIAHLAEGLREVVAVNDQLLKMNYSAPRIMACDLNHSLALIEDLGSQVYGQMIKAAVDMAEPMQAAVDLLADMASRSWPRQVRVRQAGNYALPSYDEEAQLIEVDLLPAWFHAHLHGREAPESLRQSFAALWREVLPFTKTEPLVWVLRDFHSPNLLWLPEREDERRVGLIDTQDAVLGHPAYDLASLLQDARVDV